MFNIVSRRTLSLSPINSSSRATGIGERRQMSAIANHWPARIGCSMEWMQYLLRRSSFDKASLGSNAPLASKRNSRVLLSNSRRMMSRSLSSLLKSIPPILSLRHLKPSSSFRAIRSDISASLPIHIRPLVRMPCFPSSQSDGNITCLPPLSRSCMAVSRPNEREELNLGNFSPLLIAIHSFCSFLSYSGESSALRPRNNAHSPMPFFPVTLSVRRMKYVSLVSML